MPAEAFPTTARKGRYSYTINSKNGAKIEEQKAFRIGKTATTDGGLLQNRVLACHPCRYTLLVFQRSAIFFCLVLAHSLSFVFPFICHPFSEFVRGLRSANGYAIHCPATLAWQHPRGMGPGEN